MLGRHYLRLHSCIADCGSGGMAFTPGGTLQAVELHCNTHLVFVSFIPEQVVRIV